MENFLSLKFFGLLHMTTGFSFYLIVPMKYLRDIREKVKIEVGSVTRLKTKLLRERKTLSK